MLSVRPLAFMAMLAAPFVACKFARGGDDLLQDAVALKREVTRIVAPFLHHPMAGSEGPNENSTERAATGGDKDDRPANRAWAIVVGIVTKDGRHVFGFGRFDAESSQEPDARTLFEIGSVTKTFTALLLADLVEQGKVKLSDPVRLYLPESVTMPQQGDKEITLLHLATHTSALPRIPTSIGLKALISNDPYRNYGTDDLYKTLSRTKLPRDPGERYEYSNLGFALLGHVLSRQAGKSYEELVIERICEPLELRETRVTLDDELRKRLAPPHDALGRRSSNWDFDVFAGAGALRSTTDDMLTYLEANMGLKKCALLPAMRRCHQAAYPAESDLQSTGLAWHIQNGLDSPPLIFHGGGTGGYNSIVGFAQEDGTPLFGIVVLANAAPAGDGMVANDVAVKLLRVLHSSRK